MLHIALALAALAQDPAPPKVEVVDVRKKAALNLEGNAKFNSIKAAAGHTFMVVRVKIDRAAASGDAAGSKFEIHPKDFSLLDDKGKEIHGLDWLAWLDVMTEKGFTTTYNKCKYVEDASITFDKEFAEGAIGWTALTEGTISVEGKGLDATLKTFEFDAAFLVAEKQEAHSIKFRTEPAVKLKK